MNLYCTYSLRQNHIGPAGAKVLAASLEVNVILRSLVLDDNQVGDAGAEALANSLTANGSLELLT